MPRKRFYPTDRYPYHVTARSHNKEWFEIPMETSWEIFSRYLYFATLAFGIRIHAFVLMNNHFHMLVTTPNANLDQAMAYVLREVSKTIGIESGKINQIFGGPYHWSLIKNQLYYRHAYKYVYRNPIEAGLTKKVEDYQYSTLSGLIGKKRLEFPAFDNLGLISDPGAQLNWLNTPYPETWIIEDIEKALNHSEFDFYPQVGGSKVSPLAKQLF
jgi:putative transposase